MSLDPRHYDVIVSPVITEKATTLSEQNKVVFKVRLDAHVHDGTATVKSHPTFPPAPGVFPFAAVETRSLKPPL